VRVLNWLLFVPSSWAEPATVVAGTTREGTVLDSVRSVCVGTASLRWRARQVRVVVWPLIARSAWVQSATVLAVTTGEGAATASVRLVGVSIASHCGGLHYR
jgi:hypothetical protein